MSQYLLGVCKVIIRYNNSDSHSEGDDNDLLDSVFETKHKQRKITEEMWSGIKAELVKHLPEGVDGLRVFKIPSESLKNEGKNIFKDGRNWKKNCPTEWKGHRRVRYADCKGSSRCCNAQCPFMVEFSVVNTTQFKNMKDSGVICSACNQQSEYVECLARLITKTSSSCCNGS